MLENITFISRFICGRRGIQGEASEALLLAGAASKASAQQRGGAPRHRGACGEALALSPTSFCLASVATTGFLSRIWPAQNNRFSSFFLAAGFCRGSLANRLALFLVGFP